MDELNFPWKKTASHFLYDYNFTITIIRIHWAICKVRSNNSNPAKLLQLSCSVRFSFSSFEDVVGFRDFLAQAFFGFWGFFQLFCFLCYIQTHVYGFFAFKLFSESSLVKCFGRSICLQYFFYFSWHLGFPKSS